MTAISRFRVCAARSIAALLCLAVLAPRAGRAAAPPQDHRLDHIRIESDGAWFHLIIPSSAPWAHWTLEDPPRIVIDLGATTSYLPEAPGLYQIRLDRGPVTALRTSQFRYSPLDHRARITLELSEMIPYDARRDGDEIRISIPDPQPRVPRALVLGPNGLSVASRPAEIDASAALQDPAMDDGGSRPARTLREALEAVAGCPTVRVEPIHGSAPDEDLLETRTGAPITRPITKPITAPITKPITAPVTNPTTAPITAPAHPSRPITEPVTAPPSPQSSRPVTESLTTPAAASTSTSTSTSTEDATAQTTTEEGNALLELLSKKLGRSFRTRAGDEASASHANASAPTPSEPETTTPTARPAPIAPSAKERAPAQSNSKEQPRSSEQTHAEQSHGKEQPRSSEQTHAAQPNGKEQPGTTEQTHAAQSNSTEPPRTTEQPGALEQLRTETDAESALDVSPLDVRERAAARLLDKACAACLAGNEEKGMLAAERAYRFYRGTYSGDQAGLLLRELLLLNSKQVEADLLSGIPESPDTSRIPAALFVRLVNRQEQQSDFMEVDRLLRTWGPLYGPVPETARLHAALGEAFLAAGKEDLAREHLEQIPPGDDTQARGLLLLARMCDKSGQKDKALELYTRVSQLPSGPYQVRGLARVADLEFQKGNMADALDTYMRLLDSKPPSDEEVWAVYQLGNCHLLLGDPGRAKVSFDTVAQRWPQSVWAPFARERLEELAWREQRFVKGKESPAGSPNALSNR